MKNKKAFSLVELLVAVSILAILGTISFIALEGYSENSRDTIRTADFKSIEKGLSVEKAKFGKLPIPENKIDIIASGSQIGYQGYLGRYILDRVNMKSGGKDPLTGEYYTYTTNLYLDSYQVLGYLEESYIISKKPILVGDKLGVLVGTGELGPIQSFLLELDIVTTDTEYIGYLDSISINGKITGTGSELARIGSYFEFFDSCDEILTKYGPGINNGIYRLGSGGNNSGEEECIF